ncbi:hypothetical protein [Shewanella algae]|uniref:hypothetical protein n=1 Tax=Shewanella algae TaxID=38313 RepID=UPI0031F49A71
MPIELSDFSSCISHKRGHGEEFEECSNIQAIKIDDDDGIAHALQFNSSSMSKADFLHINDNVFMIIEASDLRSQLRDCFDNIKKLEAETLKELQNDASCAGRAKLTTKHKREIKKKCYLPLKSELMQKWCGSIAVCERLCRFNNIQFNPMYKYLLVCRNGTDVQVLNEFKTRVAGIVRYIEIKTTETISI